MLSRLNYLWLVRCSTKGVPVTLTALGGNFDGDVVWVMMATLTRVVVIMSKQSIVRSCSGPTVTGSRSWQTKMQTKLFPILLEVLALRIHTSCIFAINGHINWCFMVIFNSWTAFDLKGRSIFDKLQSIAGGAAGIAYVGTVCGGKYGVGVSYCNLHLVAKKLLNELKGNLGILKWSSLKSKRPMMATALNNEIICTQI